MRHALALSSIALTALALTAACAETPGPRMQPDPDTGYTLQTTGAQAVDIEYPSSTGTFEPSDDLIAARLAAQICDREVRCHVATRSAEECSRAYLLRAKRELSLWRCSPGGARARAEECLASIGNEPCEHDLDRRRSLCVSNPACGFASGPRVPRGS